MKIFTDTPQDNSITTAHPSVLAVYIYHRLHNHDEIKAKLEELAKEWNIKL